LLFEQPIKQQTFTCYIFGLCIITIASLVWSDPTMTLLWTSKNKQR